MVTKRLKYIILIALGLIYAHGLEEIITGFYLSDSTMELLGSYFNLSTQSFYWVSHAVWWIGLAILSFVVLIKGKLLWLLSLFGIVFFIELHHIGKAIFTGNYYPGMLTAILYPLLGIFYWKELIRNWRKIYGRC